ncbi:hypothetical protein TIFTF001_017472 [Ficus carica]|uniref:BED-type domain-containing protein n=1 Tax=Ficus carica TaxID=3494 RepID=A0AA88AL78_FICCA|nr:hypothetical protein TIFTF001_017472 [Ficus carica]
MTNCRKSNVKIEGGKKMDGIGLEVNLESGSTIAHTDTNVPIDEDEEEELEAISKNPTDKAKRKRRTTSIFLSHFDKLPLSEDKRLRAKCKKCGSVYLADSKNGTGSMQHHMVACQHNNKSICMTVDEIIEDVLSMELNKSSCMSAQSSHNPSSSNAKVPMEG